MEEFDFIVVGAGSAGCAAAARLSESGEYRVALLEAGGKDDSFWIHAPLGYGKLFDHPKYNWLYESEPEASLNNSRSFQPRGKVLGGTGSINMMVHVRGQRQDFDYWRQLGNVGWAYDDVLPYFKKSENFEAGADSFHGVGGPLRVSIGDRHELADAFIAAGQEAGYSRNVDFNGSTQEGFGYDQVTISKGRRQSTAVAFLQPALKRSNLRVFTYAHATRIVMRNGEAVGVSFRRGGREQTIMARREIVLAAGSFNSPQLLQLSGIGPGDLLQPLGIPVQVERSGVGANLQDHFNASLTYHCSRPITVSDALRSPWNQVKTGLNYILFRKGLLASNGNAAGAFLRTDPSLDSPDIKLRLRLWSRAVTNSGKGNTRLTDFSSIGVSMAMLHPDSRGTVRITSADPLAPPSIRFNFYRTEADQQRSVGALRIIRRIMAMPAMLPYIVAEVTPGPAIETDADLITYCRESGTSGFHPTSTCRMGNDEGAVVDTRLRVRGVGRLRVVDAAIMPRIVGANTNATTIMIAEKGSAMILEDARNA